MIKIDTYIAGPDVFLRNASKVKELKREIAKKGGLNPLFPLDNVVRDFFSRQDLSEEQKGLILYRANILLMNKAKAIIADITPIPLRGPNMDPGTAFEIGYMIGQKKPVECYTNSPNSFADRVKSWLKGFNIKIEKDEFGVERDATRGIMIEDFGKTISDNIMIDGSARLSGGSIHKPAGKILQGKELDVSLEQFKKAVEKLTDGFVKGTYQERASEQESLLAVYLNSLMK